MNDTIKSAFISQAEMFGCTTKQILASQLQQRQNDHDGDDNDDDDGDDDDNDDDACQWTGGSTSSR